MLDAEGLYDVRIEAIGGNLTDHYDPRARVLRLSQGVYGGRSVAAAGIASHEAGHAVQSARGYAPAAIRQALVPAASIGSQAAWVLIMLGFFMQASGLITLGIAVFGAAVLFQVVTLPVEFDASQPGNRVAVDRGDDPGRAGRRRPSRTDRRGADVRRGDAHLSDAAAVLHRPRPAPVRSRQDRRKTRGARSP